MIRRITLFAAVLCLFSGLTKAQISITNLSQVYTQDFNVLENTGNAGTTMPSGWYFTGAPYRTNYGNTNNGGLYSYGDTLTITERALGSIGSGSATPSFGAKFINNTGSSITSITLSFNIECWRLGQKPALRLDSSAFSYNVGVDSLNASGWTNVHDLNLITPDTSALTAGALNGNLPLNRKAVSYTITGLAIASGTNFWIKWQELNVSGSDDGLAIDDLTVTFAGGTLPACTEPATSVTNVVLNTSGSTSVAGSFTGNGSDAYLVVIDSVASAPAITDATSYTVGQSIGSGKVASNGSSTSFSLSGLVTNTIYHAYVFPYNNSSCTGGPNYKTTAPGTDTAMTSASVISDCTQPTGVSNTSIVKLDSTTTSISIKFSIPANADSVLVFAAPTSTIGFVSLRDSIVYPVGSTIPSNGATPPTVYARGTDSSVVLSNLLENTVYKIFVVSFNNKNCTNGPNYAGLANTTIRTAAGTDCTQPSGVSNTSIVKLDSTSNTISIKFTIPANADSVLVLAGPTATVGFVTLHDTTFYGPGTIIPNSGATVYYRGTDSSVVLSGLNANTVYKILISTFNNKNCTNGPNYAGLATTTIRTAIATGIINRNAEADFALYPNPAGKGSLYVKFSNILKEDALIEVLDIAGRKLAVQKVLPSATVQAIDLSRYAKGTYILNVVYKGTNNTQTFVIE